jgi:HEAT repeat protein
MKTAAITISLLLIVAATLLFWSRSKRREINSFWDVVRNPEAMSDLDEFHQEVDDSTASLSGSPTKVAALVDYFVFEAKSSDDAWTELRTLAKLGSESYPRALAILRDPALKSRLTVLAEQENSLSLREAPINRLCEIFDQDAPPPREAAALLAPYLRSDSDEIRKSAALIIASIGSADSLPDLRRALTDQDEYVRSYALMGIERALTGDRIDASSKEQFFALVADMWPGDTSFAACDDIPQVLLKLDRDRATSYLLSDELFSVGFPPVWRILEALNEESVEVPRARILTIIEGANQEPLKYPMDNVLEQALPLLGAHHNEEDLPMIERLLEHENKDVSRGATEALYRYHRYHDQIRDPRRVIKERGWNALTPAEKHVCAIEQLDAEVKNGGFAQYYFNSSGDNWQDALEGLEKIGAEERHRVMLATIEKFGDSKPAADRDARTSQLSGVVRHKEDPFSEQDKAWYGLEDEKLDRLIFKYNLANQEGRGKKTE